MKISAIRIWALLVLLFGACQTRAEQVEFSYRWTVLPSDITPTGGGFGLVTVSAASDGTDSAELGSSAGTFIPGGTISNGSGAGELESFNTTFDMTLELTDTASGLSEELTFTSTVAGQLSSTQSTLTSIFNSPTTKSVDLNGLRYTVAIAPILANLSAPNAPSPVSIVANVSVSNISGVPEPSALLLGAVAVIGFAGRRFLNRRLLRSN